MLKRQKTKAKPRDKDEAKRQAATKARSAVRSKPVSKARTTAHAKPKKSAARPKRLVKLAPVGRAKVVAKVKPLAKAPQSKTTGKEHPQAHADAKAAAKAKLPSPPKGEAIPRLKVNRAKAREAERALMERAAQRPEDAEIRRTRLKNLIKLGKERGYLTYAEINDHLPDVVDAEQIESMISTFNDMGIQVFDEAPDTETLLMSEATPTASP